VVTYGYSAPLGFWLLRAHGHEDVRMLMGPRDQWAQMGRPWSTDVPAVAESAHPPVLADDDLLASREAVMSAVNEASQLVLDVRAEREYDGELFWPSGATEDVGRTGHVPGAVSVPIALLRAEDGTLRSADELRGVFEQAGVTKDKALITYCTIGNRASEAWFALKYLLGYPDVRVYYGSWVEWGKATDTPIETAGASGSVDRHRDRQRGLDMPQSAPGRVGLAGLRSPAPAGQIAPATSRPQRRIDECLTHSRIARAQM